ncbi:hypothetical protein IU500_06930 [Nocardia terpenica]|uniref:hypothetical protein n=1 Tax=Nocardia terpenica TaxID=455432 RepID=UPI001895B174|nr:hypothetical protein [Nocardia terpenica]MBF6060510.1 hypothetical protein [Nocardia terpenica]MBF6103770.1 hypothetical protein [Nocardia terpenica]MBF6111856.1 hypothetical protein [Nocardia terpenica]MBF6117991.1 hypothetical protein [Nocardia terpenica]MBF6155283.1 hypothetical protein [Nocardia terpenica]
MIIDIEVFTISYLAPLGAVRAEMPNVPPTPFWLVTRISGSDDGITDWGTIQVDVFAATRDAARVAARAMHARMLALTAKTVVATDEGPARIDHRRTLLTPAYLDYQDENLRRYVARYELASRLTAHPI